MKTKSTSQKYADLKRLAKQAKDAVYEMLKLVTEILDDKEYVDQFGGEPQLLEHIEANEFSHFGGSPTLAQLLRAYRKNPRRATWQEYQFNVWAMIELSTPRAEAGDVERINWKARCKELELTVEQLELQLAELRPVKDAFAKLERDHLELVGKLEAVKEFSLR